MYIIYSSSTNLISDLKFYNVLHDYNEAKTELLKYAQVYIHSQNETGYTLLREDNDDCIKIYQNVIETSKGYIWNSVYMKKVLVLTIYSSKIDDTNIKNLPNKNPKETKRNIKDENKQEKLMKELKLALQAKFINTD